MSSYGTSGYVVDGYNVTSPPSTPTPPTYVFDNTGLLPANKIQADMPPKVI